MTAQIHVYMFTSSPQGKSQKEIDDWNILVTEVCQAINSKQLVPTLRTQYMRTAFQIPFDATVRISLDTNLCMLTETGRLGNQDRWFRDPSKPVPRNEITRFPHAVLEVKLQLKVSLVATRFLSTVTLHETDLMMIDRMYIYVYM